MMAVTTVAVGEADPAWATSPTDAAAGADAGGGASAGLSAPSAGSAVGSGVRAASGQTCPSGQTYLSAYGGCRPSTCANGRRSNGTCRACADLTHMRINGACRPKTTPAPTDPACSAGQLYYSSYGGCRPASCSYGRSSTGHCLRCPSGQTYFSDYGGCRPTTCVNGRRSDGTCRACADPTHMRINGACRPKTIPAPTDPACSAGQLYYSSYGGCRPSTCANGRTSTGTCRPCPSGQTQLAAFGTVCVPEDCTYGRTSTGTCEATAPTPRYSTLTCTTYSANASAREYLDANDKLDQATCPPQGLFEASPNTGDWPKWGFQKTVAKYYGMIIVSESSECSWFSDTGPSYDFQIPCKAHDYCFDLRRAGLSGTVLDDDCDNIANSLIVADCKDRTLSKK